MRGERRGSQYTDRVAWLGVANPIAWGAVLPILPGLGTRKTLSISTRSLSGDFPFDVLVPIQFRSAASEERQKRPQP